MEMDLSFANRRHNCIYSAQKQAPTQHSVQIMNGFRVPSSGAIQQGAAITEPFPASANVKWAEPTVLSTDPTTANFLVPDWADTNVQKCILDQGWLESGVKDPDRTIADLGAISKTGGRPVDIATLAGKNTDSADAIVGKPQSLILNPVLAFGNKKNITITWFDLRERVVYKQITTASVPLDIKAISS